jgi:hypothetical protein
MRPATTILVLSAALAAGCGGGGGKHPSPHADFLRQADRVCRESGIRPQAIPSGLPQAAEQLAQEARLRSAVHARLTAIKPPADVRVDYTRFLAETDGVARDMQRMAALARGGRQADFAELGRRTGLAEAARFRLAARIGFRRCGRPIVDPVRP